MRHGSTKRESLIKALDKLTGNIIHVKDTSDKHKGHLICPSTNCNWPVMAVKPSPQSGRAQHYRHYPEQDGTERFCSDPEGAQESIIHKEAKEILLKRKNVFIFPYMHPFTLYRDKFINPLPIGDIPEQGKQIHLTNIEMEVRRISKDYQPDIVAEYDGDDFIVEIRYKHPVDEQKIEKIKRDDIAAIEITLSHLGQNYTQDDINRAFFNNKRFKWLHYPQRWLTAEQKSKINEYHEDQINRIDQQIEESRRQKEEADRLREQRQKDAEDLARFREAERWVPLLFRYLVKYVEYRLLTHRVTPFSRKEHSVLQKCRREILNVNNIFDQHGIRRSYLVDVPTEKNFNNAIQEIGNTYRKTLAQDIVKNLPNGHEWMVEQIIELLDLGWDVSHDLNKLYNYERPGYSDSDDGYATQMLNECREYIKNIILKICEEKVVRRLDDVHKL